MHSRSKARSSGQLKAWARQHGVWLLGGSFPEATGDERVSNTSTMISPAGEVVAVYRKIHLFDVDLGAQGGQAYRESASIAPGSARNPRGHRFRPRWGMSICYDLRFPELYRALTAQGARFLAVPSAFAPQTGRDHWEPLLRARAIENQCFVVAPAQWGQHNARPRQPRPLDGRGPVGPGAGRGPRTGPA